MSSFDSFSRRRFLRQTSAIAVTALTAPRLTFAQEKEPAQAPREFIVGKDKRLIIHNNKVGEVETPLELLRESKLTPKELLFVRNNQVLPGTLTLDAAEAGDWKIDLGGLIDRPTSISVADLAQLPQEECELVLQCSGNGRSRFAKSVKAEGVQWQHGAMGNVKFKGVKLKTLLDHLRVQPDSQAKFVAAEGKDSPAMPDAADFEHSLPLSDVLDRSLLALSLNDQPIPKVHGGPVRLVTPGYYATMNVKWLSRLRFEERESSNHHHAGRYRTPLRAISPGSKFATTLDNSEPNWNMRIKSVIFAPLEGEKLSAGKVTISGVAWNDG